MRRMFFINVEYAAKSKEAAVGTSFEMDQVKLWIGPPWLIKSFYPSRGGRQSYPLEIMLRIHYCKNGSR